MGGFNIEGSLYSDPSDRETTLTFMEKLTQFICWVSCGHNYVPIDTIHIENRRYYFRTCKRCNNKDEGYA